MEDPPQILFISPANANYINIHLQSVCESTERLRHYFCPKCHEPKGNPAALVKRLLAKKKQADTECDACGVRFPLWDALERALRVYAQGPKWRELQRNGMSQDFSWEKSAKDYAALYQRAMAAHSAP